MFYEILFFYRKFEWFFGPGFGPPNFFGPGQNVSLIRNNCEHLHGISYKGKLRPKIG